jgi:hypothetical protein
MSEDPVYETDNDTSTSSLSSCASDGASGSAASDHAIPASCSGERLHLLHRTGECAAFAEERESGRDGEGRGEEEERKKRKERKREMMLFIGT